MKLGVSFLALMAALLVLSAVPSTAAAEDYDCADFANQAEAEEHLLPGDPYGLDADNDGIACEDLPCPCSSTPGSGSSGGGGESEEMAPPPPPPYHLKKSAARHEARRIARKFTNHNPNVNRFTVGPCNRKGERRIDCEATAKGNTSDSATTCHLRVAVRAVNRHPVGRLTSSHCTTKSTLRLSADQARAAIRQKGAEVAGKPVVVLFVEREGPQQFLGAVEWTQRNTEQQKEECSASFEVEMTSSREIRTSTIESSCGMAAP